MFVALRNVNSCHHHYYYYNYYHYYYNYNYYNYIMTVVFVGLCDVNSCGAV